MNSEFVWTVVAIVLLSGAVQFGIALWLRNALRQPGVVAGAGHAGADRGGFTAGSGAEGFADLAPELVNLARAATNTAIRNEEVHEWHQLDLFPLGSDDISEAVRDKLRRASFDAVAARSALFVALRRNRGVIPTPLAGELGAFCERLEPSDEGTRAERKRRLAADLDALERHLRDYLGADMRGSVSARAG
ncbi:MAG TPA: hypothetical protein VF039_12195 [Longimicrobiales bacterium]